MSKIKFLFYSILTCLWDVLCVKGAFITIYLFIEVCDTHNAD